MQTLKPKNENMEQSVLEYRVEQMEEAIKKLGSLADIVARWDARLSESGPFLDSRLDAMQAKQDKLSTDVDELKSHINKWIGALILVGALIQFIPSIWEALREKDHPTSQNLPEYRSR